MNISELKKQAALGDADALYKLGCRPVTERNHEEAFQSFHAAVQLGHAEAISALGRCFLHGIGTEQNVIQAVSLFREASAKGVAKGTFSLGLCHLYGWGVEIKHDTPEEPLRFLPEHPLRRHFLFY